MCIACVVRGQGQGGAVEGCEEWLFGRRHTPPAQHAPHCFHDAIMAHHAHCMGSGARHKAIVRGEVIGGGERVKPG
jgi:hypothetical protein